MSADEMFYKKIQMQALHLEMNIYWRLGYFIAILRKKNEKLTQKIL